MRKQARHHPYNLRSIARRQREVVDEGISISSYPWIQPPPLPPQSEWFNILRPVLGFTKKEEREGELLMEEYANFCRQQLRRWLDELNVRFASGEESGDEQLNEYTDNEQLHEQQGVEVVDEIWVPIDEQPINEHDEEFEPPVEDDYVGTESVNSMEFLNGVGDAEIPQPVCLVYAQCTPVIPFSI